MSTVGWQENIKHLGTTHPREIYTNSKALLEKNKSKKGPMKAMRKLHKLQVY